MAEVTLMLLLGIAVIVNFPGFCINTNAVDPSGSKNVPTNAGKAQSVGVTPSSGDDKNTVSNKPEKDDGSTTQAVTEAGVDETPQPITVTTIPEVLNDVYLFFYEILYEGAENAQPLPKEGVIPTGNHTIPSEKNGTDTGIDLTPPEGTDEDSIDPEEVDEVIKELTVAKRSKRDVSHLSRGAQDAEMIAQAEPKGLNPRAGGRDIVVCHSGGGGSRLSRGAKEAAAAENAAVIIANRTAATALDQVRSYVLTSADAHVIPTGLALQAAIEAVRSGGKDPELDDVAAYLVQPIY